jgi:hypothetical protein
LFQGSPSRSPQPPPERLPWHPRQLRASWGSSRSFDTLWAEHVTLLAREEQANALYQELKPEHPPALLRRAGVPGGTNGEQNDWHWCPWSLQGDDAPPNAAELLPIAEAYEAADERAKEASGIDRAEAEWQAAFDQAKDVAEAIIRSPCATGADFAIKLEVWNNRRSR